MNERFFRTLTIVFFILAVLILLITLLLVYTPLKDLFFKKPIAEETIEELAEETKPQEQTATKELTEETEETSEETTTKEEPIEEIITIEEDTVPPEREPGEVMHTDEAKHQGYVKDIDYENRIIIIKNEITGVIVKLDDFSDYLSVKHYGLSSDRLREFEDIKVGYYIFAITEKEAGFNIYEILGKEPDPSHNYNKIYEIILIEEVPPPGWPEDEPSPGWLEEEK